MIFGEGECGLVGDFVECDIFVVDVKVCGVYYDEYGVYFFVWGVDEVVGGVFYVYDVCW